MNIGPGPSWGETWRWRGGSVRGGEIRRRNVVVFFLSGRCGRARQAVVQRDCRARWKHCLRRQWSRRKHGTPHAAGGHVRGRFGLLIKGKIGEYRLVVHRIGKEVTVRCHHCDASVESAQYTLDYCPAWTRPCRDLTVEIEWDLSPPAILETILVSEIGRRVVTSFCEQVMLRKEAAELPPPEDRPARARQRPWTRFDEAR